MDINLVIVRPFGQHAVGDIVTSTDDITAILASEHSTCVVRIPAPSNRAGG